MKSHYKYTFLVLVLTVCISCKKEFLDVEDDSVITRQQHVKDLLTTGEYLNGIYVVLDKDFYSGYNLIYPELIADNVKPTSGSLISYYNWLQKSDGSSGSEMMNLWMNGYQIARSCSFVIAKADEFRDQNAVKADNMKAQAYAIRALVHFVMVNVFAQSYNFTSGGTHPGIPYVSTPDWTVPITQRNSVSDVYANIISDLNAAIPLFNPGPINVLYMNRNAAKALLARTYLFKEDFAMAKNIAVEVVKAVPLMTGGNYPSKLFTSNESEALFQIPPASTGISGAAYDVYPAGVYYASSVYEFNATADIATILNEDPRDLRSIWVTQNNPGLWDITKFPSDVIPGFPIGAMAYYQTLFRSSEMYLTAAESYARLSVTDSARFYLDAIRLRANPGLAPTNVSGAALLDSMYKERRKEFAFEGFRMFDLLRLKKGVNRNDVYLPDGQNETLSYPNNRAIAPLPKIDVDLGIPQNPGY